MNITMSYDRDTGFNLEIDYQTGTLSDKDLEVIEHALEAFKSLTGMQPPLTSEQLRAKYGLSLSDQEVEEKYEKAREVITRHADNLRELLRPVTDSPAGEKLSVGAPLSADVVAEMTGEPARQCVPGCYIDHDPRETSCKGPDDVDAEDEEPTPPPMPGHYPGCTRRHDPAKSVCVGKIEKL